MRDHIDDFFRWLKGLERFIPYNWRKWYYGLPRPLHHLANWTLHGLTVAVIVLVFAAPGMIWTGQPFQFFGAMAGYGLGLSFYLVKEWRELDGTSPWWDHAGDIAGPILIGLLAVQVFG